MTYADLAADGRYTEAIGSSRTTSTARPISAGAMPTWRASCRCWCDAARERHHDSRGRDGIERAVAGARSRAAGATAARQMATSTVAEYCKAYRRAGNYPLRRRQIGFIVEVGTAIDRTSQGVRSRGLPMMRQPARLAGMSRAAGFPRARLRGVSPDGRRATSSCDDRRRAKRDILEAIAGGATDPFPDPLTGARVAQSSSARMQSPRAARRQAGPTACRAARRFPSRTRLQRRQQPPEIDVEHELVLADHHRPVHAGPLEIDLVAIPLRTRDRTAC